MPDLTPRLRAARATDAPAIAALHADSWRRHYRGAYADDFLDSDVAADRDAVWAARLTADTDLAYTHLAEQDGVVVGFVHVILDHDPVWGALVENLHVAYDHQRRGIGDRLLRLGARTVAERRPGSRLHLWVLEQNARAQSFYRALGGANVERGRVPAPGGVPTRLKGTPECFRYAWTESDGLANPRTV